MGISTETQTLQEVGCLPSLQMEDVSLETPPMQASPEGSHPELLSLTSACGEHHLTAGDTAGRVWGRWNCSEGGKGARAWLRTQPGKVRKGAVGRQ